MRDHFSTAEYQLHVLRAIDSGSMWAGVEVARRPAYLRKVFDTLPVGTDLFAYTFAHVLFDLNPSIFGMMAVNPNRVTAATFGKVCDDFAFRFDIRQYLFLNRQAANEYLCHKMVDTFGDGSGKLPLIIMGDYSAPTLKNQKSTRGSALYRDLVATGFHVLLIDEYNTSKLCSSHPGCESPEITDRTLLCQAVFGAEQRVIRICVPNGSGSSFNLKLLGNFANVLTRGDMRLSGSTPCCARSRNDRPLPPFDRATAHDARMHHFRDSLLLRAAPELVAEHFARYPVIHLDLSKTSNDTLGNFNRGLVAAVIKSAISAWANALDASSADPNQRTQRRALAKLEKKWLAKLCDEDRTWENRGDAAVAIFSDLLRRLGTLFDAPFVVLVDNYDEPLRNIEFMPWERRARQPYLRLLRCALADNIGKLFKVVLVGNHPLPLDDTGLDMGSLVTVEVAPGRRSRAYTSAGPVHNEALALIPYMFGLALTEVRALVAGGNARANKRGSSSPILPEEVVMQYCFSPSATASGVRCSIHDVQGIYKHYRSGGVMQKLRSHAHQEKLDPATVAMLNERPMEMVRLATMLICEYDADTAGDAVDGDGTGLCYKTAVSTPLGEATVGWEPKAITTGDGDDEMLNMDAYLSEMILSRRLAVWADDKLRIPNGRFRRVWENIRLIATSGTENVIGQNSGRATVMADLYQGRAGMLLGLMKFGAVILNLDRSYSEYKKLEALCCYIASDLKMPQYLASDRSNIEFDYSFFRELHTGRTSWEIVLHPFGRYVERLVILFEFVRIAPDGTSDEAANVLAEQALQTIGDSDRARSFLHCDKRLDVGISFRRGLMCAHERFWKRAGGGRPAAKDNAPQEEWEELPPADQTRRWQDDPCWKIVLLTPGGFDDGTEGSWNFDDCWSDDDEEEYEEWDSHTGWTSEDDE
ncbi:hypothetical protein IWQ56_001175 [Coemansia nantahalensis]|nr:hypothetical protein IWQ56_001175 [Coemansia nantahalensis]